MHACARGGNFYSNDKQNMRDVDLFMIERVILKKKDSEERKKVKN